jgi:predicted alpha/beta hydrolase family esterase
MQPLRGDWMVQLEEAVLAAPGPVVLAAHSLGCILTAAWAAHSRNTQRVVGALLVAPGDPEREELRAPLKSWSPVVLQRLPFPSTLVGSQNDPYCSPERAQQFASAWGADWVDYWPRRPHQRRLWPGRLAARPRPVADTDTDKERELNHGH